MTGRPSVCPAPCSSKLLNAGCRRQRRWWCAPAGGAGTRRTTMATVAGLAEEHGILPIPRERRALGLWDGFVLWADLGVSFLVMVVGMFLVPGLGLAEALLAILIGAVIGNLLLGLGAIVGSDTGAPTMVLLRAPLGLRGSYAPTALNVVQLVGWAALEVIVMAQAMDALVGRVLGFGSAYYLWIILFTALTAFLALGGPVK